MSEVLTQEVLEDEDCQQIAEALVSKISLYKAYQDDPHLVGNAPSLGDIKALAEQLLRSLDEAA